MSRPGESSAGSPGAWNAWQNLLALSQIGFGLEDIRKLTMRDMVILTDLAYSAKGSEASESSVREATQEDIDRFLS